jgi:hypothetical protein
MGVKQGVIPPQGPHGPPDNPVVRGMAASTEQQLSKVRYHRAEMAWNMSQPEGCEGVQK